MNSKSSSYEPTTFPWLQERVDAQGLDGWWIPCLHHIFRDALLYHGFSSPLHALFRPPHLVFWVDKNLYPWLWEGPEEEFSQPRFNQGVSAQWRHEDDPEQACLRIQECLASGRIPIIRLEWFHVPFNPSYKKLRGFLHAIAVLDYRHEDRMLYILDRSPLPASRGGFEKKDQGWIPLASLEDAIREEFSWFDYKIEEATAPWQTELRSLLLASVTIMREGHRISTASSDHGLYAIRGFTHFIDTLDSSQLATNLYRFFLRWHLPPCIRKYILGQKKFLHLILSELPGQYGSLVAQAQALLTQTMELWDQVAASLYLLGYKDTKECRTKLGEQIANLSKLEEKLTDAIEALALEL